MTKDVQIQPDGAVVGTFIQVTDYTGFSEQSEEQEGYFLPIKLDSGCEGKNVTIECTSGTGGKAKSANDTEWVLRLPNEKRTVYSIKAEGMADLTLTFQGAIFATGGSDPDPWGGSTPDPFSGDSMEGAGGTDPGDRWDEEPQTEQPSATTATTTKAVKQTKRAKSVASEK